MWPWRRHPRPSREVIIVSGLPRSGTSMMMRMLAAGGMAVLTDHQRPPDEDNPRGYFELEAAKRIKEDASFLAQAQGKAVKLVSALLYYLPADRPYRVIFMERHLAEVLASQKKMLQRRGKPVAEDDARMAQVFAKHLAEVKAWLAQQPHIACLYVSYHQVIAAPQAQARAVNRFLGGGLDVKRMAQAVEAALYRNRAS
ncbi:MAG: hypothetical protein KatS3mg131_1888 [Candidatus Tectimicrobiota bacterium]|nr:MAG: hypothetical protein KatS3mg131_1888 [Candidatus Tectomicrobia bacterium]